jgi:hypothetical protein
VGLFFEKAFFISSVYSARVFPSRGGFMRQFKPHWQRTDKSREDLPLREIRVCVPCRDVLNDEANPNCHFPGPEADSGIFPIKIPLQA